MFFYGKERDTTIKKLSLRLDEREYDHLKRLSEASGLKMEPLVRGLIMGMEIKPRPPEAYAELLRHMAALGNNVNQIARVANGTGHIRREDIHYIQEMQGRLWRELKAL